MMPPHEEDWRAKATNQSKKQDTEEQKTKRTGVSKALRYTGHSDTAGNSSQFFINLVYDLKPQKKTSALSYLGGTVFAEPAAWSSQRPAVWL